MSFANQIVKNTYKLTFEYIPIILVGGIYANIPGEMMPIVGLYGQLGAFAQGILGGRTLFSFENFFARFQPMSGGTVIDSVYGKYPFANQQVAANAEITQILTISMMMIAPVKQKAGYATKLLIMQSTINQLRDHIRAGGRFHVLTPSYTYLDILLTKMTDITPESDKQKQIVWQLDFEQPLVTQSKSQVTQNNLIQQLSSGARFTPPTSFY